MRRFCCYGCYLAFQVKNGDNSESTATWLLIRLGLGAFLAMNIMLLSLLLYSGTLTSAEQMIRQGVVILLWILATPVLVLLGGPILNEAWRALRQGRVTADALISIAALSAYVYSAMAVLAGRGDVYFDTATMLLVLFTLGRFLEASGRAQVSRNLEPLFSSANDCALVTDRSGTDRQVRQKDLVPGQKIRILPGARLPVDGVVVSGRTDIDEAVITGESRPVAKSPGDSVYAGSINLLGHLVVECTSSAAHSTWANIGAFVRQALLLETPIQRHADRWAAVFVPGVLLFSVLTVAYWSTVLPFDRAMLTGLAVLVVACPCALGLAAPMATTLGIGILAQRGCIVRTGAVFEKLARLKGVAFDKTGTLTEGRPWLVGQKSLQATDDEVLQVVSGLEWGSEHPVAKALVAAAMSKNLPPQRLSDVKSVPGMGVRAGSGKTLQAAGSAAFMDTFGWQIPPALQKHLPELTMDHYSLVWVGWDNKVRGLLWLDDQIQEFAAQTVQALQDRGLHTVMLTGDREPVALRISKAIGVKKFEANLLPIDKVKALDRFSARHGAVAMVGDGINDAPVMASAAVSVAVGGASDLVLESADVVLPENGLHLLPWVIGVANVTNWTIKSNLAGAFGYNLIALVLAGIGWLHPLAAASLMVASSIAIILNSLGLNRRCKNLMQPVQK